MGRRRAKKQIDAIEVIDLADDGRGVAKVEGKTVFIDQALPTERGSILLQKRRRQYDEATWVEREHDAKNRIAPRCEHFGVCGGCVTQHISVEQQRELKQAQVLKHLERVGATPASVLPPVVDEQWHYRRRARIGVKWVHKKNKVVIGFRERHAPYVNDGKACHILIEPVAKALVALAEMIATLSIKEALPQIEIAGGDEHIALVFRVLQPPSLDDQARIQAFCEEHGFIAYLQPGGLKTVQPLVLPTPDLTYALPAFDVELVFTPIDFIQVHAGINAKLISQLLAELALRPTDVVLDLFCGLGNVTLPLARHAKQVVGVELDEGLLVRARANAKRNALDNIEFLAGDLFTDVEQQAWVKVAADVVVLDPPRAGAEAVCKVLVEKVQPRVIGYVSCHPATLARDAEYLCANGYNLTHAGIADMFPHTAHVETMAIFKKA